MLRYDNRFDPWWTTSIMDHKDMYKPRLGDYVEAQFGDSLIKGRITSVTWDNRVQIGDFWYWFSAIEIRSVGKGNR